jgi:FkbM family methyltransferase
LFSFEPVKKSFEELQHAVQGDSQWKAFNIALGAREATAEINVASHSVLSSFLAVSEYGKQKVPILGNSVHENVQDGHLASLDN